MSALAAQRCLNHPVREAVARCPECGGSFCRECITEHDERIICAACVAKVARAAEKKPRRRISVLAPVLLSSGVLAGWIFFYMIGKVLLATPSSFHEGTFWEENVFSVLTEE